MKNFAEPKDLTSLVDACGSPCHCTSVQVLTAISRLEPDLQGHSFPETVAYISVCHVMVCRMGTLRLAQLAIWGQGAMDQHNPDFSSLLGDLGETVFRPPTAPANPLTLVR